MSQKDESLALLPTGFVDLLPPQAQAEADSIRILMDHFSGFGYKRIKPPLLEFEDGLLAPGPGERTAAETFRIMDPVSHRMLGVRSDITPQIARIVTSRLGNEARPLRLMYANDVLRIRGSQMRTERQFTQVGCELVGGAHSSVYGDIEICVLALTGAKKLGVETLTLDMTIPGLVDEVLIDVSSDERASIVKAVAQRDADILSKMNVKAADVLARVMHASGSAASSLKALKEIPLPQALAASVLRLEEVVDGIEKALSELSIQGVSISIDLLEQDGFEYHKDIGFTLFSDETRGELGRGGAYAMQFGKENSGEIAKGFTLYMDTLSKAYKPQEEQKCIFVRADESWSAINDLQAQGWVVVRGQSENEQPQGCQYVYKNGKVTSF